MTTKKNRFVLYLSLGILLASPFASLSSPSYAAPKSKKTAAKPPEPAPHAAPDTSAMITQLPGEPLRITIPSLDNAKQQSTPATNRMLQALFSRFLERSEEREILAQPLPFLSMAAPNVSLIYSVASRFVAMASTPNEPPLWEKILASAQANHLPFFSFLPQPTIAQATPPVAPVAMSKPLAPQIISVSPTAKPTQTADARPKKGSKETNRKLAKADGKHRAAAEKRMARTKTKGREKQFTNKTRTEPLPPIASNDLPPPPMNPISLAPSAPTAEMMAQLAPAAGDDDTPVSEQNTDTAADTKPDTKAENESTSPREDFSVVKLFDQLFPTDSQAANIPADTQTTVASGASPSQQQAPASHRDLESGSLEATTIVASTDSIPPKQREDQVAQAALPWNLPPAANPSLEVSLGEDTTEDAIETPPPSKSAKKQTAKKQKIKYKRDKKTGRLIAQTKPNKKQGKSVLTASRKRPVATQTATARLPWHNQARDAQQDESAIAQSANEPSPSTSPENVNPLAVIASIFTPDEPKTKTVALAPAQNDPRNTEEIQVAMSAPVTPVDVAAIAQLAPAAGSNPPASTQNMDETVLVPSTPDVLSASTTPLAPLPPKEALVPATPTPTATPAAPAPSAAPAQPAPTEEDEKQVLLRNAPTPPPATPAVLPETADAIPPAPPAPAAPALLPATESVKTEAPQVIVPSQAPAPPPAPVATTTPAMPTAPATQPAAPVQAVTEKKIDEPRKPNARALLLETEQQVKSKRGGTSSKELLDKLPRKLTHPEPPPRELAEPFVIDRVKTRREIFDPTDDTQVQNAKHEAMGVKIEVKTPRIDTNYELEKAYNALMGGQSTVAQEIYRNVLDSDPNNVLALFGMATSYHRSGQFEKARTLYSKILAIDPDNRDALNNFLALVSSDAPEESLAQLEKLEANNPEFSPIPAQMAVIYQKLGNPEKAMQKMLRAVSLEPENLTYRYNLAVLMDRQGKREEAASLYRQLVSAYQSGASIPGDLQKIQERLTFLSSTNR